MASFERQKGKWSDFDMLWKCRHRGYVVSEMAHKGEISATHPGSGKNLIDDVWTFSLKHNVDSCQRREAGQSRQRVGHRQKEAWNHMAHEVLLHTISSCSLIYAEILRLLEINHLEDPHSCSLRTTALRDKRKPWEIANLAKWSEKQESRTLVSNAHMNTSWINKLLVNLMLYKCTW